jgi:hypothetical protein
MDPQNHRGAPTGAFDATGDSDVVEHVPWDRLTVSASERPPWVPYLVAGAVTVALVAVYLLLRPEPSAPITLAPATTVAAPAPAETMVVPSSEPIDPAATTMPAASLDPLGRPLYAEADLLAFAPIPGESAAASAAEWFVMEYFSSSNPGRVESLSRMMASGISVDPAGDEAITYVDWARATDVRAIGDETFAVRVRYRTLVSRDGAGYEPGAAQVVEIVVAAEADGATVILDLPTPVPDASPPERAVDRGEVVALGPEESERLLSELAEVGSGTSLVEITGTETGYRVVFDALDAHGVSWRYATRWDPERDG